MTSESTMIEFAYHPIVQAAINQWRLDLPVVPQLDENAMTKEHLRLLIAMLIAVIERNSDGMISDLRPPTSDILH